ncbi:MAG TPA: hypothetical protein VFS41_09530 [Edaphobacter sp.]|nr:hypothetical protein [Edaphobacter sp.]
MKRFSRIATTLVAFIAIAMATGCRKPEMQRCVDQQNVVVDDDLCHALGEQRILGKKPEARSSYRYYYGGTGSTEPGTVATGGSLMRERDRTYAIAGQDHRHLKVVGPVAGLAVLGVAFFFFWEGRQRRA